MGRSRCDDRDAKWAITRRAIAGESGGSPWLMRRNWSTSTAPAWSFEEVAEGTGLERREEMIVVVVDRDHDRLRLGLRLAQRGDDVDARSVGQAEVDQGDVDRRLGDDRKRGVDARCVVEHGVGIDLGHLDLEPGHRLGDVFQQ